MEGADRKMFDVPRNNSRNIVEALSAEITNMCEIGVNKINNVFIDNLSLQTNNGMLFDLPLDRIAGKGRRNCGRSRK